jgi:AraC-like DNA-binding protein
MRIAGRGEIAVWEGASFWLLEAEQEIAHIDFHSHHAIQLTFSLGGAFELESAGERLHGPAVAVAADAPHVFRASGRAAFLFVEPESAAGIAIAASLLGDRALAPIPAARAARAIEALAARPADRGCGLEELGRAILADLACACSARPLDPRVDRMIAFARSNLDGAVSLSDAVADIGLSPSRLRHLFVEQTGLPFKTYLLWLRIRRAVDSYAGGASLTAAAHEAGFADSAHFSRTFRRTFGLPAAALRVTGPPPSL